MELVTIIQNGGPLLLAAVFAYLFWAERQDRKEVEKQFHEFKDQFIERGINAANANAQSTRDVGTAMNSLVTIVQNALLQIRGGTSHVD